jgi:urea transporter
VLVVFLAAILVNSRISAAFAVLGSAVALLGALAIGADGVVIYHRLYGFNAVLCAIAISGLFFVLTWKSALYALLAAMFSVPAFAAIAVLLSPIGMPALTALRAHYLAVPVAQEGLPGARAGRVGRRRHRREHPRRLHSQAGPDSNRAPGTAD